MEEDLDDCGSVPVEMLLEVGYRLVPFLPQVLLVEHPVRKLLTAQQLRVDANDEHFLVIGPVEDADPPALRQPARAAPQEVVLQLLGAWLLEAEHLAARRIDAGHD